VSADDDVRPDGKDLFRGLEGVLQRFGVLPTHLAFCGGILWARAVPVMTADERAPGDGSVGASVGGPVFAPLRPTSRRRVVARAVAGPLLWVVVLVVVAVTLHRTDAIEFGLLFAVGSFAVSVVLLLTLRAARLREERRDAEHR
jgi:hypothetical protein